MLYQSKIISFVIISGLANVCPGYEHVDYTFVSFNMAGEITKV
jgi:hypothetical protein